MPTREEFWQENHRRHDIRWLTGTDLPTLLETYELPMPAGLDVTEIGVGVGLATRELALRNRLTVVDIAEDALVVGRAAGAIAALHTSRLHEATPADLVICHLVFQHCETSMVDHLLSAPLKPRGVYAFQTGYSSRGGWNPIEIIWHPRDEVVALAARHKLTPFWERSVSHEMSAVDWSLIKCHKGAT